MPNLLGGDVARLRKHIKEFDDQITGKPAKQRLERIGKVLAKEAEAQVRATPSAHGSLSDQSMSGWNRGSPIKLATRVTVKSADRLVVTPDRTAGLWRVLNDGREGRAAGSKRARSKYVKKSGETRIYHSRVKRNSGPTPAKHTWDLAEAKMAKTAPKLLTVEVTAAFSKSFKG